MNSWSARPSAVIVQRSQRSVVRTECSNSHCPAAPEGKEAEARTEVSGGVAEVAEVGGGASVVAEGMEAGMGVKAEGMAEEAGMGVCGEAVAEREEGAAESVDAAREMAADVAEGEGMQAADVGTGESEEGGVEFGVVVWETAEDVAGGVVVAAAFSTRERRTLCHSRPASARHCCP